MDDKTLIDTDYDDEPWEVDESPESVVAKVEAAKRENKLFVELIENHRSGKRIWVAVESVMAVYGPAEEDDEEPGGNRR